MYAVPPLVPLVKVALTLGAIWTSKLEVETVVEPAPRFNATATFTRRTEGDRAPGGLGSRAKAGPRGGSSTANNGSYRGVLQLAGDVAVSRQADGLVEQHVMPDRFH